MDFNTYDKDVCFNYSVISEQMIGALYKIRKGKELTDIDKKHVEKGKGIINLIIDGNLLQSGKTDLNLFSKNNNLFIFDYGSLAIMSLKQLNKNDDIVDYLKYLVNVLNFDDFTTSDIEHVEDFFNMIGELLDKDIEESKYTFMGNQNDIFSTRYLYN